MTPDLAAIAYLVAAICFILALKGLASPASARRGNAIGIAGMVLAVAVTVADPAILSYEWIAGALVLGGAIGATIALRIHMTAMPQLVAAFHSLVGMAAVLVAAAALYHPHAFGIAGGAGEALGIATRIEMILGMAVGAITFSGSVVAFAKLQGVVSGAPLVFRGQHLANLAIALAIAACGAWFVAGQGEAAFWLVAALAFVIGVTLIVPIGGADMPVVVSMLNSYSGWAAAGIGFTLENELLIITGALVGSSGAILSYVMCKGMNRSFIDVILGGFGGTAAAATAAAAQRTARRGSAEDAAFVMANARKVIVVPGYGMAVALAQHALRDMADRLKAKGVEIAYAIHPVAGRMPGHMNVLLAEAQVPYDEVFELEEINSAFAAADVAFVIGANDVCNPLAKTDPQSPIAGMPVLEVWKAPVTLVVKRSLSPGYAGIDNPLFYRDGTMMLFADARKMVEEIARSLE